MRRRVKTPKLPSHYGESESQKGWNQCVKSTKLCLAEASGLSVLHVVRHRRALHEELPGQLVLSGTRASPLSASQGRGSSAAARARAGRPGRPTARTHRADRPALSESESARCAAQRVTRTPVRFVPTCAPRSQVGGTPMRICKRGEVTVD